MLIWQARFVVSEAFGLSRQLELLLPNTRCICFERLTQNEEMWKFCFLQLYRESSMSQEVTGYPRTNCRTFELWLFVERTLWKKMMPFRVTSHQKLKPSCSPVNSGFYRWVSDSRWRWFQLPRAGPSTETTTTKCTCYLVDLEGRLIKTYIQANTYATKFPRNDGKWYHNIFPKHLYHRLALPFRHWHGSLAVMRGPTGSGYNFRERYDMRWLQKSFQNMGEFPKMVGMGIKKKDIKRIKKKY